MGFKVEGPDERIAKVFEMKILEMIKPGVLTSAFGFKRVKRTWRERLRSGLFRRYKLVSERPLPDNRGKVIAWKRGNTEP